MLIKKQCTERKTSIDLEYSFPRLKTILGILMIILGILLAIITYGYVFPIGSIVLVVCGTFLIIIRNHGRKSKEETKCQ